MLIFRVVWSEFKVNQQNPTGAEWICCLSFIQPAGTQTDRQKMRTEQLLSFTDNLKCILLLCRWQQGLHQQQVCFYFCKTRSDSKESGMNFVFFYDLSFFYVTIFMCSGWSAGKSTNWSQLENLNNRMDCSEIKTFIVPTEIQVVCVDVLANIRSLIFTSWNQKRLSVCLVEWIYENNSTVDQIYLVELLVGKILFPSATEVHLFVCLLAK